MPAVDRPNADRWNAARSRQKTDENNGHYVIASSRPPERRQLERRSLVPIFSVREASYHLEHPLPLQHCSMILSLSDSGGQMLHVDGTGKKDICGPLRKSLMPLGLHTYSQLSSVPGN